MSYDCVIHSSHDSLPQQAGKDGKEGLSEVLEGGHSEVAILWEDSRVHGLMAVVGNLERGKFTSCYYGIKHLLT